MFFLTYESQLLIFSLPFLSDWFDSRDLYLAVQPSRAANFFSGAYQIVFPAILKKGGME